MWAPQAVFASRQRPELPHPGAQVDILVVQLEAFVEAAEFPPGTGGEQQERAVQLVDLVDLAVGHRECGLTDRPVLPTSALPSSRPRLTAGRALSAPSGPDDRNLPAITSPARNSGSDASSESGRYRATSGLTTATRSLAPSAARPRLQAAA